MEQYLWIFWVVLAVGLLIAEIFTLGFVLFWFGLGAAAAAIAGFAGGGLGLQFILFAAVSIGLTVMSRTIFARYFAHGERDRLRTGAEALPGMTGTVTAASRGALDEGAVKVYGSEWKAFPIDGETKLIEGEKVEVVEVRGSSIYVRKADDDTADWRGRDND